MTNEKENNGFVSLSKVWLIIIVVAAIGSPFVTFGILKQTVANDQIEIQRSIVDIKEISDKVNTQDKDIAVLNSKMDTILRIVTKIETKLDKP